MRRFVLSKWAKTVAVLRSSVVRPYIPATRVMTKDSLLAMLSKYKMVYVKPDNGTFGNGVMRVDYEAGKVQAYRYHHRTQVRKFARFDDLYTSLKAETRGRKYLVQKGIRMLKHHNNPFDLRVMVQSNLSGNWETTGVIGRVAHPTKIVTNYHNGGKLRSVEALLSPYLKKEERLRFEARLSKLGLDIAKAMKARYPGIVEVGVDVAVDHQLHPWVLEVNTRPDPYIFRALKDKRIFAKVLRYRRNNRL
ncbi:YheC/YheD family protein [Paenibacillus lutrae]|uniref:YheC/YheD family protein n=1 Tax=Paenibacillus lutrae TaxID=2078573 RepID=A0A7X3FL93_9BACL|nr:YheC/YheD family protein [Paenibacillus lutrae]MVP01805.1 YheC/YheD family protein [Paenibacillus lutrae]